MIDVRLVARSIFNYGKNGLEYEFSVVDNRDYHIMGTILVNGEKNKSGARITFDSWRDGRLTSRMITSGSKMFPGDENIDLLRHTFYDDIRDILLYSCQLNLISEGSSFCIA